ncbi:HNH endonuclease [Paradesulfitobacterium aromaticivorans]
MQKHYRQYEDRICVNCGKAFIARKDQKQKFCSHGCYSMSLIKPVEERFMSNVQKTDSCWIWTGHKANGGYGIFHANHKSYIAHRFYYALHHGPIPEHIKACHKCDNPACVNPDHIFLGTQSENLRDAVMKGRRNMLGEDNPFSKLTEDNVLSLRRLYANGITKAELARRFQLSKTHVGRIISREVWAHI